MSFQKNDRVIEGNLVGTVTKMHRNGAVVDVLFDGEEYARRRQVKDIKKMRNNPRKPSRQKYGVVITGKFKGFTKSAGGQLKAGIFETQKYGTVFFPATNYNTNWLLFKHSSYSPQIDIFVADRGTIQNFDSLDPSDFRYIELAKGKDILVLPEWLANTKGLVNESDAEKRVLKSRFKDHFTLPSQQPKENPCGCRKNPREFITNIPLVIACGATKNAGKLPVNQKYASGFWSVYRNNTPSMPNKDTQVYVLSAKYGLLPETAKIDDYDAVLVADNKRTLAKNEVKASSIAKKLASQLKPQTVLFVGSSVYADALKQAGFNPVMLEDLRDFPNHKIRGGIGKKNQALAWFIGTFLPSKRMPTPQRVVTSKPKEKPQKQNDLATEFLKGLYEIRVNGIYKGLVRKQLGLPSSTDFGTGRKRLDHKIPQTTRRELLNKSFAIATQAMRREGTLAPKGAPKMLTTNEDHLKVLVAKTMETGVSTFKQKRKDYEETLKMARKK